MAKSHFSTKDIAKAFILLVSLLIVWLIIFGPPGSKKGLFWGEIKNEDEFWAKERQYRAKTVGTRIKVIALEQIDTYLVNDDLTYSKDSKIVIKNVTDSDIKSIEVKTLLKDNIVEIAGQGKEKLKFARQKILGRDVQLITIYFKESLSPEGIYQFHIISKYPKLRRNKLICFPFSYLPYLRYQISIDTSKTSNLYMREKGGSLIPKMTVFYSSLNSPNIMETGTITVSLFSKK